MILDISVQFFHPVSNGESFVKDYLPYISTGIIVFIFVYDRYKGHLLRLEEKQRSWYFKAYFENSIVKIDEFIFDCDRIVEMEINKSLFLIDLISDESVDLRSSEEKLSDCKRKFSLSVVQVLQLSYSNLFENLEEILRNIEDEGIKAMENIESKDQYWKFVESLNKNKALILAKMSEPAIGKIKGM